MIKTIYLHVGLHKTGTTTIQEILGKSRNLLKSLGYLYPEVILERNIFNNHSLPFYSLFKDNPETYFQNQLLGYSTIESIKKLNENYADQIRKQIESFEGEVMVISGEDITRIHKEGLKNLKSFLVSLSAPGVAIKVIMFLRHPLDYYRSIKLELLKNGTVRQGLYAGHDRFTQYLQVDKTVVNLFEVFGAESVSCVLYEDAARHKSGLIGAFLHEIGLDTGLFDNYMQELHNFSMTYEANVLYSAVIEKFPHLLGNLPNPAYDMFCASLISKMPGVKFVLPKNDIRMTWEYVRPIWADVCQKFHLPEYQFYEMPPVDDKNKWGDDALDYFIQIIPKMHESYAVVLLDILMEELRSYKSKFTPDKKGRIFAILMFYSAICHLKTKFEKITHFTHHLGLVFTVRFLFRYKRRRRFYVSSFVALQQKPLS